MSEKPRSDAELRWLACSRFANELETGLTNYSKIDLEEQFGKQVQKCPTCLPGFIRQAIHKVANLPGKTRAEIERLRAMAAEAQAISLKES